MGKMINGFELQSAIFLVGNRPCKIFLPSISTIFANRYVYWVLYLDTQDVELVKEKDLKVTKNGGLLYDKP